MTKTLIFGATGMTGMCSLEHAVRKGINTRVFVRDENKIPEHIRNKIEVHVGNVTNPKQVEEAVQGVTYVCVVLGTRNDLNPTTELSDGLRNILLAMRKYRVNVISICLSAFLFYEPEEVPAMFQDITKEHQRMFDLLKESKITYIACFPPHITENPSSKYIVEHNKSPGRAVSKFDLGEFLITCLERPEHYNSVCGLANISL